MSDTLGWIYYKKGLASLAIPHFQDSVQQQPDNATFRYHLGLAYAQAGDSASARRSLERALALASDFDGAADARRLLVELEG